MLTVLLVHLMHDLGTVTLGSDVAQPRIRELGEQRSWVRAYVVRVKKPKHDVRRDGKRGYEEQPGRQVQLCECLEDGHNDCCSVTAGRDIYKHPCTLERQ